MMGSQASHAVAPGVAGRRAKTGVVAAALAFAVLLAALATDRADAAMEITEFDTEVSTTQAGGHPDTSYKISWTNRTGTVTPCNCEDARILDMHFPTGFIGNPHAVPQCTLEEFSRNTCPPESQVGVIDIVGFLRQAIYNLQPHANEPGLVGFTIPLLNAPGFVVLHGRTGGDYGLDATSSPVYHILPINTLVVRLWGVPADSSHDANRFPPERTGGVQCEPYPGGCFAPLHSNAPRVPYLQNPTTCGATLTASHTIEYYTGTTVLAEDAWPPTTGCDQLSFDPSLTASPTSTAADTPSGLDINLKVPQPQSATAPSPSEIRSVKITMPKGFSLAPNGANGKTACADSSLNFETENAAECPEFAKIGTTTIDSSALPGPIHGAAYIGQPLPDQTFRLFLTADGFATHVKLKGSVDLDPQTGQVVTRFVDLPQSPIQEVDVHFFGSERGIFGTPTHCGSYPVEAEFVPWDGALENQTSTSFFKVDSGPGGAPCPPADRPFNPRQTAGTTDNTAGTFSPFTLQVARNDGDQNATGVTVKTPPGFLASLKGVSYCPEAAITQFSDPNSTGVAEQAAPACPAASRVGGVTAGAGPGSKPVYVRGSAYLAGPYKGSPLSLVVVIPAVSGPYDLGNVAVRVAVDVDPVTARVSTVSDPLPQILEGVPLRTRFVQIRLDRPGFTLNPTSCDPFAVETMLSGDEGAVADLSSHFQVANCSDLGYAPRLNLSLNGGLQAHGHPRIHAVLKAGAGEANSQTVSVTLPKGELLDNAHIGTVCTRVDFAAESCPDGSRIGKAEATTPLLDDPLRGSVYLRSSSHRLPDLVMDLRGQVNVELVGRVDSVKGRLRTTFESIPDAPVSTVTLDLAGRSRGLLINSEGLCGRTKRATVSMVGQNGVSFSSRPKLQTACRSKASSRRHTARKGA